MGRRKGVPQTGRVAAQRRERAVQRTAHKEAIVQGTIASDMPEPLVPELFQDIQITYWNCLKAVPDPRAPGQIVYPLYQILHRILAGFLTGARCIGVLFPRQHRIVIDTRSGRGWRLCALPTRVAVYRLLRRVDWAAAQVALAPLWERLGYAPEWVMTRRQRDPKEILEEFRPAEAEKAARKAAELKAAQRAAEKTHGMSAAQAGRPGRRVRSAQGKSTSTKTPLPPTVAVAEATLARVTGVPMATAPPPLRTGATPMRPLTPRAGTSQTAALPAPASSASATLVVAPVAEPNVVGPAEGPVHGTERQDLLLDGKVVRASYHTGCQERFVHATAVRADRAGERQRFIVGARPTVLDRNGEWGAALAILDTLLPVPGPRPVLISGDAGVCVEEHAAWLSVRQAFYLFRIKANAGHLFERVIDWAEIERARRPEGDFFEAARVSGADIHSRRLWRLPGLRFASFPGLSEAFVVEKKSADAATVPELQYYITSYPRAAWTGAEILERILLHWDTETGVFGVKDGTFDEDAVRYKYLEGAMAHVVLLNTVMNGLWAPLFAAWWLPNTPLSHRIQLFRDHPDYFPFQPP